MDRKIRFLLSRDDYYHQRGYWVLAAAFRNAGIEVILGGIQTPRDIVETLIQEDVDIVGYRIMDADPGILVSILFERMMEKGVADVPVVVGGIISNKDEIAIKEKGVKEVFHPYSPLKEIIERVKAIALAGREKRRKRVS